jgi:hypothetical protein
MQPVTLAKRLQIDELRRKRLRRRRRRTGLQLALDPWSVTIDETMDQCFGHAARRDHLDTAIVVDAHGKAAGTSAAAQHVAR